MFTILVVEDNADMRELFCTVLSDKGYRVLLLRMAWRPWQLWTRNMLI